MLVANKVANNAQDKIGDTFEDTSLTSAICSVPVALHMGVVGQGILDG